MFFDPLLEGIYAESTRHHASGLYLPTAGLSLGKSDSIRSSGEGSGRHMYRSWLFDIGLCPMVCLQFLRRLQHYIADEYIHHGIKFCHLKEDWQERAQTPYRSWQGKDIRRNVGRVRSQIHLTHKSKPSVMVKAAGVS